MIPRRSPPSPPRQSLDLRVKNIRTGLATGLVAAVVSSRLRVLLGAAAAALRGLGGRGVGGVAALALALGGLDGGGIVVAGSVGAVASVADLDRLELLASGPEAFVGCETVLEAGDLGELVVVGLWVGEVGWVSPLSACDGWNVYI